MSFVMASVAFCIVGCGTGSPDQSSLKVLECDPDTGAARLVQSVDGCEGTTYFQFSGDGCRLYSVVRDVRDGSPKSAAVAFALDCGRIGAMTRLADLPCEAPCHVALSPDGGTISFAAYLSGTYGILGTDGRGLKTAVLPDDAVGPRADRQKKAYAHQTFYTPDGRLMGVCDLGCDRVVFYDYAKDDGLAKPVMTLRADPGDGPRHALFHPNGRHLYVVNELSSSVTAYSFDGTSFSRLGKWSMLPDGCNLDQSETKAAAIKLTADGRILMASNRGHDSIAFFDVCDDGTLRQRNVAKLRGKFPRDFELMPGEKFMVVGHKMSNEIQIYAFDRAACSLSPVGEPIPCWRPLCFKFMVGRVIPNAPSRQLGDKLPQ